jgi:uncharacterized protein
MLRSFRVANHKSIHSEAELLLAPVYDKNRQAVPVAAILGANASGKSNLLDALRWMQQAVRTSYASWEAGSGVPRTPFRLDVTASVEPSLYAVDLLLDGVQYVYGFSATDERIEEEWLHSYPHRHKRVIFERNGDEIEFGSTIPERRGRAELLTSFTRDNSLLLSAAAQAKQEEVLPVYQWFRDGLREVEDGRTGRRVALPASLADRLVTAVDRYPEFLDLLRAADLGISDLGVVETVEPPSARAVHRADRTERQLAEIERRIEGPSPELRKDLVRRASMLRRELDHLRSGGIRRELVFLHGSDKVALGAEDQSDGTLSWIALLVPALEALSSGSVVFIDEIDSSLHPRLTARMIELFHSTDVNGRGAQLIFTTHDATLLGTSFGREVLARDEIWFVEKDTRGATSLYPLTDFHPRKEENTERRYLGGSYGAVPAVYSDTFVETIEAIRAGTERDTP